MRLVERGMVLPGTALPSLGWLRDARGITRVLSLLVLSLLVVVPLVIMLLASVRPAGTLPLESSEIVLSNFADAFLAPNTLAMLGNTLVFATVPVIIALPLAFGLAFLTERTDLPMRGAVFAA